MSDNLRFFIVCVLIGFSCAALQPKQPQSAIATVCLILVAALLLND